MDEIKQQKQLKQTGLNAELDQMRQEYDQYNYSPTLSKNLVHIDMSGFLYTRVYNNNFDISYGCISCAIKSKNMDELYDDANAVRRVQPAAPPDYAAQLPGQPQGPHVNQVSAETDRKC